MPDDISKDDSFVIAQDYFGCSKELNIGVGEKYDFDIYLHPDSYYGNGLYFIEHHTLGESDTHF